MNKTHKLILAINFMVFGVMPIQSAQHITIQNEQAKLKHIYTLYKNNLITAAQFSNNGEIIDEHIALLDKYSEVIVGQKSNNNVYSGVATTLTGLMSTGLGTVSIGCMATAGVFWKRASDLWNSYNVVANTALLDLRPYGGMVKDFYKNIYENPDSFYTSLNRWTKENLIKMMMEYSQSPKMLHILAAGETEIIKKKNQNIMRLGFSAPVIGGIGAIIGITSLWFMLQSYGIKVINANNNKLLEEQYEMNQVIIAQLKEIKQTI